MVSLRPSAPWASNPKKWEECLRRARQTLLDKGFEPLSGKLPNAVRQKALRLYRGA